MSIDTLAPLVLKPDRSVRVSGIVSNSSGEDWGDVQVGLVTSAYPFTNQSVLESASEAAEGDPDAFIGERIVDLGTFDDIGTIAPGEQASYSLRVPYSSLLLSGAEGVYWLGVQVNANLVDGRATVAQERTFVPLLDQGTDRRPVEVALLWPLTGGVPLTPVGYRNDRLAEAFDEGGRLETILEMGTASAQVPITWVLDPALLDAADDMADGYVLPDQEVGAGSAQAELADRWRDLMLGAVSGSDVLALPYGDPDVASLAHAGLLPALAGASRAGTRTLNRLDVAHQTLLWPAAGFADRDILTAAPSLDADTALLSRATLRPDPATGQVAAAARGVAVDIAVDGGAIAALLHDDHTVSTALQPGRDETVLAWRQQLLARTALMALEGGRDNRRAVVAPPREWWPDERWPDADFFAALDAPWINAVSAGQFTGSELATYGGDLVYPERIEEAELPEENLEALRALARSNQIVLQVLEQPDRLRRALATSEALSASTAWRAAPVIGRAVTSSYVRENARLLRKLELETPSFVTLSSQSGQFPVTISNDSGYTVTVGVAIEATGSSLDIEPVEPVTIEPDQRRSISVLTNSDSVGIADVDVRLVTPRGRPFGVSADFQVRTTQIGAVIWVVMGLGAAVLFVAAGRRITQRVRMHRRKSPT